MPTTIRSGLAASSGIQGTQNAVVVTNVVIGSATAFQPQPSLNPCPANWSCQDIGNPITVGDQSLSGSTYTVKGAGNDIWSSLDTFHYVWQQIAGDVTVNARVISQTNTDSFAKAGLMMRLNTDNASANYAVFVTPSNGVIVQYRNFSGFTSFEEASVTGTAPAYIQISRFGNAFTAYTSSDGTNWSFIPGSTVTIPNLSGTISAGIAVTSHNGGTLSTATFDSVSITNSSPSPADVCRDTWTCENIGFPTPSGDQALHQNIWTIDGGGADIWETIDSFRYIYQDISGDGTISARIVSQTNSNDWAKAGMMVRLTNDQSSPYFGVFKTPTNGVIIQYRLTEGGGSHQISAGINSSPVFVQINRNGTTYSASTSNDGITWTVIPGSSIGISSLSGTLLAGMAITSHNTVDSSQVVFDNVIINGQVASSGCPVNYTCGDIGSPTLSGSTSFNNNTFTLNGAGNDIWTTDDQFQYAYQALNGDGEIVAKVNSQTNTNPWAKAGVMIKESVTPGSKYVLMAVTPSNGLRMQYNFTGEQNGGSYTFPIWVKVKRIGNTFKTYSSSDGTNWIQVGTTNLAMNNNATAGLFVTSHSGNQLSIATFSNVTIASVSTGVPSPWTDSDIGQPAIPGSAYFSGGIFTVNGAGDDIWTTDDKFNYVNQPLNGDGSIIARVTSQANTDPWAKAGIMIKESTVSGSKYVLLATTPNNGLRMQYNFTNEQNGGTYIFSNAWMKLTRSGNTFTTFKSTDRLNWNIVGSTTLSMNTNATVGLFVTSHNGAALGNATFDNVTVSLGGALPGGWSHVDIGSPSLSGSAGFNNGTFTITGAGNDIWQNMDQFQYAYQSITGNTTIISHINSQTNTDPWAKAGIMIKESTVTLSPYILLSVTPGNGLRTQYNFTSDISDGAYSFPHWVKLTRVGNTFTSYISINGTTWSQVNQATLNINASATAGLFVTSHNGNQVSTAAFDNTSITNP